MTSTSFRMAVASVLVAAASCLAPLGAAAQDSYPSRPITVVMPYAPGGPGDTITRVFAGSMQRR